MYILISLHKRIKLGLYRHELGIVSLKMPFITVEVYPSSFNKQVLDTFRYVHAGNKFVAVGSGEWTKTLDDRAEEMRKSWDVTEAGHWKELAKMREELSKMQSENSVLKRAIKIVGDSE